MAAAEEVENAGNEGYQGEHMAAIFKEGFSFSGFERDLVALSLGDGTFRDVSGVSGADSISDGRGSVFADLDNDGDLDIFLTAVQNEAHHLFRNNVGTENGFLRVVVHGTRSGRDAFGTVVRVKTPAGIQTKIKAGGSGFLSQSDPRLLFGLGAGTTAEWVEVTWPNGSTQRVDDVASGTCLVMTEGEDEVAELSERRFALVDPLPPEERIYTKLAFDRGGAFPDLPVRRIDGTEARLADLRRPGRRTLVNLWATYCIPCRREMPELQALDPRLRELGIDLVGVSIDVDTVDLVPEFVAEMGVTYPIVTTPGESVPEIFSRGEVMIPTSFLLDDQGRVEEVFVGWNEQSEKALLDLARPAGATGG